MAERKNLTITQVEEIKKVGDKQIPKLSFRAREGDSELAAIYFTFKSSLFELIKEGQTINADVETKNREYEGNTYTDRRVVQIYVDGQPVINKGQGFSRGKSPEELELSAKSYALSYAKDLVVAQVIPLKDMTKQADINYNWLKGNGDKPASLAKASPPESSTSSIIDMDWLKESLEEMNWADVSKWLKAKYPEAKGNTIKALVGSLTREHQEAFVKEVQTRLEIYRNSQL